MINRSGNTTRWRLGFSLWLALLFASMGAWTAAAQAPSPLQDIRQKGVLVVGVKTDYAPWGGIDAAGEIVGLEIDLARNVADRLGVETEFVGVSATNRLQKLQQREVDLVIATMAGTEKRAKLVTLVEPQYYTSGVSILLNQKSPIRDWAQVRGRNICLTKGAFYNRPLIERFLMVPQFYSGTRDTRLALKSGSCEGWIYDDSILKRELLSGAWEGFYMPLAPIMDKPWTLAIHHSERGSDFHEFLTATVIDWHRTGFILARERAWGLQESPYLTQQMAFWQRQNKAADHLCQLSSGGVLPDDCRPHPIRADVLEQEASGWHAALKSYGFDLGFLKNPYDRRLLLSGLWHTLMLSVGSIVGSLVIGISFALMRHAGNPLSRLLAITVGEGFRQTPPLLHLYIVIFGLGSYLASGYDMHLHPLLVAIVCFSLYAGAANGRILAQSLALSREKELDRVPLMYRLIRALDACYESLVANSVNLVKLVGMASIIAVPEIIGSGNSIIVERGNQTTIMNILLLFYLILVSLFLAALHKGKGVTELWAKRIS